MARPKGRMIAFRREEQSAVREHEIRFDSRGEADELALGHVSTGGLWRRVEFKMELAHALPTVERPNQGLLIPD